MYKYFLFSFLGIFSFLAINAQNPLFIPPTLSGTSFSLTMQPGMKSFYPGTTTPTFGINGAWMAPTLILNKGDNVTMNVHNSLPSTTTLHWHGMHVAAMNDGGPHQIIPFNGNWTPSFTVLNNAGTFWYHPHGEGKTDYQVSKGIAGMIIVKDPVEAALTLPRTYGVDDLPVVIQSKAFDVAQQIAIATDMDTALFVNGTLNAFVDVPSQIVRLRLLNGSSMRSYMLGFTNDMPFTMIATDAGLRDSALTLTRLRLSPGERAEILIDLNGKNGQILHLKNYGTNLPNGIYGAASLGNGLANIPDYFNNFLNGADYNILEFHIGAQTTNPVTTIPTALVPQNPWSLSSITTNRTINLTPSQMDPTVMVMGPFLINGKKFNMDSINIVAYLNTVEKWKLVNTTMVAHPFHIHGMHFYITSVNGNPVPKFEQGKKDVVLVMPNEYIEFVTKWEDFADDMTPYMYHCHLLHHEDDGMMGSFVVRDTLSSIENAEINLQMKLFPNPTNSELKIQYLGQEIINEMEIFNVLGSKMTIPFTELTHNSFSLNVQVLPTGLYMLTLKNKQGREIAAQKWIKE